MPIYTEPPPELRDTSGPSTLTPYWWRSFYRKHPLTERCARTVAETEDYTHSWFEGHEVLPPSARRLAWRVIDRVCWLIAFAAFVALLTAPRWWPQ